MNVSDALTKAEDSPDEDSSASADASPEEDAAHAEEPAARRDAPQDVTASSLVVRPEIKAAVLRRMRGRAYTLKVFAGITLVLIIVVLSGGVYGVLEIERLINVKLDVPIDQLKQPLGDLDSKLATLQTSTNAIEAQAAQVLSASSSIGAAATAPSNTATPLEAAQLDLSKMQGELAAADQRLSELTEEKKTIESRIAAAAARQAELLPARDDIVNELAKVSVEVAKMEEAAKISGSSSGSAEGDLNKARVQQAGLMEQRDQIGKTIAELQTGLDSDRKDLASLTREIGDTQQKIAEAKPLISGLQDSVAARKDAIAREQERQQAMIEQDHERVAALQSISDYVAGGVAAVKAASSDASSAIQAIHALEGKIRETSEQRVTSLTVSTISVRLGLVLIVLFLVQILVTLYRYNMRLAFFYDGRADALDLYDQGPQALFMTLVEALSPDKVDFGKPPASPAQQALELAKAMLEREKR